MTGARRDPLRQDPLTGMPDEPLPRPVRVPVGWWRIRRNRQRRPCDRCIADIHAHGVAGAPYPGRVRWEWVAFDGQILRLCERHHTEQQEGKDS